MLMDWRIDGSMHRWMDRLMRETKSKQELAFVNANFSENPTCSPNAPLKATREASRGGFAHEHWPTPNVHPCSRLLVGVFVAVAWPLPGLATAPSATSAWLIAAGCWHRGPKRKVRNATGATSRRRVPWPPCQMQAGTREGCPWPLSARTCKRLSQQAAPLRLDCKPAGGPSAVQLQASRQLGCGSVARQEACQLRFVCKPAGGPTAA